MVCEQNNSTIASNAVDFLLRFLQEACFEVEGLHFLFQQLIYERNLRTIVKVCSILHSESSFIFFSGVGVAKLRHFILWFSRSGNRKIFFLLCWVIGQHSHCSANIFHSIVTVIHSAPIFSSFEFLCAFTSAPICTLWSEHIGKFFSLHTIHNKSSCPSFWKGFSLNLRHNCANFYLV